MLDIQLKVLEFFRSKLPNYKDTEILKVNYIDEKTLDSISIIQMIAEFENYFEISFTQEDIQSDSFRTVSGLISLINNKKR
jgi:acyl carrier protein